MLEPDWAKECRLQAMRDAGPQLHKALYDLLHALHPGSQRVAAANARELLGKVEAASQ